MVRKICKILLPVKHRSSKNPASAAAGQVFNDASLRWMGAVSNDGDGTTNGIYEGEFRSGKRHGEGTFDFADGRRFTGSWSKGLLGQGLLRYPNGDVYEGGFSKTGAKHGRGTYRYASGALYEGFFEDNAQHGLGRYWDEKGVLLGGEYLCFLRGKPTV